MVPGSTAMTLPSISMWASSLEEDGLDENLSLKARSHAQIPSRGNVSLGNIDFNKLRFLPQWEHYEVFAMELEFHGALSHAKSPRRKGKAVQQEFVTYYVTNSARTRRGIGLLLRVHLGTALG
jgi:hypothetical protein